MSNLLICLNIHINSLLFSAICFHRVLRCIFFHPDTICCCYHPLFCNIPFHYRRFAYPYIYIYIYSHIHKYTSKLPSHWHNRVFTADPGDWTPRSRHTKDSKKWYLMSPCLKPSIIRYWSRLSGANQRKELLPSLHLGVVAIEKEAFESPSTTVGQLFLHICIYIYLYIEIC